MAERKKVTIDQVAAKAHVSKTTVSRYLNGRYDMMKEETRQKIEAVIRETDYRPSRIAQSLKSNSRKMIGCLVGDISSPFSSLLIKGVSSECKKRGYQLLLLDSENDPVSERNAIDRLLEQMVDGLIINSTGENDSYILDLAHNQHVPIVMADRALSIPGKMDTVVTDNEASTYKCLQYLKKIGYTRVAFFTQNLKTSEVRRIRYNTFCEAVEELFGYDGRTMTYNYSNPTECEEMVSSFLSDYPLDRVAIFAVNGVSLLEVMHVILRNPGIQIGKDLGVCGFDNWGWADMVGPGITTITQDSWNVGAESAKLLFRRIDEGESAETETIVLTNRLEIRGSTVSA